MSLKCTHGALFLCIINRTQEHSSIDQLIFLHSHSDNTIMTTKNLDLSFHGLDRQERRVLLDDSAAWSKYLEHTAGHRRGVWCHSVVLGSSRFALETIQFDQLNLMAADEIMHKDRLFIDVLDVLSNVKVLLSAIYLIENE